MNDGSRAFPSHDDVGEIYPGMSLRDYFAAAALKGILAQPAAMRLDTPPTDLAAKVAYAYADAMLAARTETASEAAAK